MKTLYVLGGSGSGKSTFLANVIKGLGSPEFSGLTELHARVLHKTRNLKTPLHGHHLAGGAGGAGVYLGHMRDQYPGTDGLARPVTPVAVEYLDVLCGADYVVAEGQKLMTRPMFTWLRDHSDPLFVHLVCDYDVLLQRVNDRVENNTIGDKHVRGTSTGAEKILSDLKLHDKTIRVDTTELPSAELDAAVGQAVNHIIGGVL